MYVVVRLKKALYLRVALLSVIRSAASVLPVVRCSLCECSIILV